MTHYESPTVTFWLWLWSVSLFAFGLAGDVEVVVVLEVTVVVFEVVEVSRAPRRLTFSSYLDSFWNIDKVSDAQNDQISVCRRLFGSLNKAQ